MLQNCSNMPMSNSQKKALLCSNYGNVTSEVSIDLIELAEEVNVTELAEGVNVT